MKETTSGFTIVELLIVIVVVAVLAAISIVAYNGIQNRAYDSTVENDLKNLATKVAEYRTLHDEQIPTANQAGLEEVVRVTKSAYEPRYNTSLLYCRTDTDYGFVARSRSGSTFVVENGVIRSVSTSWGGSDDNNACGANTTLGFVYGADAGYGYLNLYRNFTWQSWVQG